jgi:hypothetical protein
MLTGDEKVAWIEFNDKLPQIAGIQASATQRSALQNNALEVASLIRHPLSRIS